MFIYSDFKPIEIHDDIPTSKFVNTTHVEEGVKYMRDGRTNTIHVLPIDFEINDDWYFKYLKFLNNIVTMGLVSVETEGKTAEGIFPVTKISQAQALIGAGFLPLAVEPSFTSGQLSLRVKRVLDAKEFPYKETQGTLFTRTNGYLPADIKDIWIHRMDYDPQHPQMVTTMRVWKEFGISGTVETGSGSNN